MLVDTEIPVLDISSSVEWSIRDLPEEERNEIWCFIILELNEKRNLLSNVKKEEYKSLKELQHNTEITITRSDKGGAILILQKEVYRQKIVSILASGEYVLLNKDPTSQNKRRIYKLLFKFKDLLEDKVRTRLTLHHFNVPYIYGLPKVCKEQVPLRLIVTSRFGLVYELSTFLL